VLAHPLKEEALRIILERLPANRAQRERLVVRLTWVLKIPVVATANAVEYFPNVATSLINGTRDLH
jgi:hypothetical protein